VHGLQLTDSGENVIKSIWSKLQTCEEQVLLKLSAQDQSQFKRLVNEQHRSAIDDILKARHTVRYFSQEIPRKDKISAIIQSGLIAPFAALAVAPYLISKNHYCRQNCNTPRQSSNRILAGNKE